MSFVKAPITYAYLNVKIQAKKSRILQISDFDRLIKASNIEEVARILSNTAYGDSSLSQLLIDQKNFSNGKEIDRVMTNDFQNLFDGLSKHLPSVGRKFGKVFIKKFFYDSLKVILRAKHRNLPRSSYETYVNSPIPQDMELLLRLMEFNNIGQIIDAVPNSKIHKLLTDAVPLYEQMQSTLPLEQAINIGFYSDLWREASLLRDQARVALRLIGTEIDLINIETILRAKILGMDKESIALWLIPIKLKLNNFDSFLGLKPLDIINMLYNTGYRDFAEGAQSIVEGTEEPAVDMFEGLIKKFLVHESFKAFRGGSFHLGIFIAFFFLKRVEFENVRAIILGKLAGLDQDTIKDLILVY
ncbi:MAG: V-type ATPase subunit [Candidatus Thorarchaeota archaeon]